MTEWGNGGHGNKAHEAYIDPVWNVGGKVEFSAKHKEHIDN